tara:strand:+ start:1812 stop:2159 length:348 start_codon:yes stop_codon:yes gene_type:complete
MSTYNHLNCCRVKVFGLMVQLSDLNWKFDQMTKCLERNEKHLERLVQSRDFQGYVSIVFYGKLYARQIADMRKALISAYNNEFGLTQCIYRLSAMVESFEQTVLKVAKFYHLLTK